MINLIPDHVRANNRYAYKNVRLIRYTLISAITMALILAITALGILSMARTKSKLEKEIVLQKQQIEVYKPIEKQGEGLSDQLKTINTLLDRQVTFSELLPYMSKVLPPGAILRQLDFSAADILPPGDKAAGSSKSSIKKPFTILAAVKERSTATTLLQNIKTSKDLFSDAYLIDISQQTGDQSPYPLQVSISAFFQKDALQKLSSGSTAASKTEAQSR